MGAKWRCARRPSSVGGCKEGDGCTRCQVYEGLGWDRATAHTAGSWCCTFAADRAVAWWAGTSWWATGQMQAVRGAVGGGWVVALCWRVWLCSLPTPTHVASAHAALLASVCCILQIVTYKVIPGSTGRGPHSVNLAVEREISAMYVSMQPALAYHRAVAASAAMSWLHPARPRRAGPVLT